MFRVLRSRHVVVFPLFAFVMLGGISTAAATDYYVDASAGSTSNPGTSSSPFKNLDQCGPVLHAGDTCYVRNGTYAISGINGNYLPLVSGTSNNPIVFKAAPGQTPVLQGAVGLRLCSRSVDYVQWEGFTVQGGFIVFGCPGGAQLFGWKILKNKITGGAQPWGPDDPDYSNFTGLFLQDTVNVLISDNEIYGVSAAPYGLPGQGSGMKFYRATGTIIENNYIHDNNNEGFNDKEGGTDNVVRRNIFKNNVLRQIYLNNQKINLREQIYENIFICTGSVASASEPPAALWRELQVNDASFYSNTVYGCSGVYAWGGGDPTTEANHNLTLLNNILAVPSREDVNLIESERWDTNEPTVSDYNLLFHGRILENRYAAPPTGEEPLTVHDTLASWKTKHPSLDVHSKEADPVFVNAAGDDFHLATTSPARGAGQGGIDMGAYPRRDGTVIGVRTGGVSDSTPPAAPTGLRVVP